MWCVLGALWFLVGSALSSDITLSELQNPPRSAKTTASGLTYQVLKRGKGKKAKATSKVTVHYTGWLVTDGRKFDSSVDRGQPVTFSLDGVIKGWAEGVQLMKAGGKARFWIPGDLAYGDAHHGTRPYGTLMFEVELLAIVPPPPIIKTPKMKIPKRAKTTDSGVSYLVLRKGSGDAHPNETDIVTVHYTGWQVVDGRMFDSSLLRGQPASFPLNRVIAGWKEAVQLMVVGETARFWIPADLAYGDHGTGGRPKGTLLFDIELVESRSPNASNTAEE